MPPSAERLHEVFGIVERRVEERWGVPVVIGDVPHPFTGDLDGAEIKVDHDLPVDDAVFILLHLFGHTVQWNVSPDARAIGLEQRTTPWSDAELATVAVYEHDACAYSLQLLHDCGVFDLDQWVSDFAACDTAYLLHQYRTGEKREFRSFWREGQPLVTARPIPEFTPQKWVTRWGTVI